MAHIFISYAKKDRKRVEPLAKSLEKQGWTVWWDPIIPTGKDFDDVIEEEISIARCVIVIWSKRSIKSKYVKGEAREALNRGILIPVEIESGIKPPFDFRSTQTLSLINWDGSDKFPEFQKLIYDVTGIIGKPPVKKQAEGETAEAKRKAEEEQKPKEVNEEIKLDMIEPAKVKPSEPKLEAKATAEPKNAKPSKKSNTPKFGVVAGVVVLLLIGIWWWISSQQVNEVRQELNKLNIQALNLESALSKLNKPEQIEEFARQRDTLSYQTAGINEGATKAGFRSQLEELQNRLKQIQIQLANKEKELMVARKGRIFVATMPDSATVKILNIDEPFQQGMELKPGKYEFLVSSEGYDPQDRSIDLGAGEEKRLNVELEKIAETTIFRPLSTKEGWAYLGEYQNGTWVKKYFGFPKNTDPPSLVQTQQEVASNLNVREGMRGIISKKPVIYVLKAGDYVEILEVKKLSLTGHMYARIRYKD